MDRTARRAFIIKHYLPLAEQCMFGSTIDTESGDAYYGRTRLGALIWMTLEEMEQEHQAAREQFESEQDVFNDYGGFSGTYSRIWKDTALDMWIKGTDSNPETSRRFFWQRATKINRKQSLVSTEKMQRILDGMVPDLDDWGLEIGY